jgi:hypothetical protein
MNVDFEPLMNWEFDSTIGCFNCYLFALFFVLEKVDLHLPLHLIVEYMEVECEFISFQLVLLIVVIDFAHIV